jgi:hypothetical protein
MKNKQSVGLEPADYAMATIRTPDDMSKLHDVSKLIRKLRWIGLEEDARQLQRLMFTLSPGNWITVPSEPSNTD